MLATLGKKNYMKKCHFCTPLKFDENIQALWMDQSNLASCFPYFLTNLKSHIFLSPVLPSSLLYETKVGVTDQVCSLARVRESERCAHLCRSKSDPFLDGTSQSAFKNGHDVNVRQSITLCTLHIYLSATPQKTIYLRLHFTEIL